MYINIFILYFGIMQLIFHLCHLFRTINFLTLKNVVKIAFKIIYV